MVKKGVHGAYVVEHELVVQDGAREETKEVQTEEHLQISPQRETLPLAVEEKIAVASHPHIRSNVNTDGVVHFLLGKVVVHHEHDLHPPFPLIRLLARQQHVSWRFSYGAERHQENEHRERPELQRVGQLLSFGHKRCAVEQEHQEEDERELPARTKRRQHPPCN